VRGKGTFLVSLQSLLYRDREPTTITSKQTIIARFYFVNCTAAAVKNMPLLGEKASWKSLQVP